MPKSEKTDPGPMCKNFWTITVRRTLCSPRNAERTAQQRRHLCIWEVTASNPRSDDATSRLSGWRNWFSL